MKNPLELLRGNPADQPGKEQSGTGAPVSTAKPPRTAGETLPAPSAEEIASWFNDKDFTTDWVSRKIPSWLATIGALRQQDREIRILEVGSYEGHSVVTFLELFPRSHVTAIDLFPIEKVEERFDHNISGYGDRCHKIKGQALSILSAFGREQQRFDVIYLDAGKRRSDTLAQSILAWPLLPEGGYMIWDDLRWRPDNAPENRPADGINLFAKNFRDCMVELHRGSQLIVQKTGEWPSGDEG